MAEKTNIEWTDATDIIDRLYATKGPDRELDARIWCLSYGYTFVRWDGGGCTHLYPGRDESHYLYDTLTPKFTASLDLTKQLIQRLLPGWAWRVASCCVSDDAWVFPDFNDPIHGPRLLAEFPQEEARRDPLEFLGTDIDLRPPGREAIALCIALLTALKARSAKNG